MRYYFPFLKIHEEGLVGSRLSRDVLVRIHEPPPPFLVALPDVWSVTQLRQKGYVTNPPREKIWMSVDPDVPEQLYHYRCDSREEAVLLRLKL